MAEYYVSPPEERLPEETPAPAPGAYPPPAEDAVGSAASGSGGRSRRAAFRRGKNALLFAAAGAALCGVIAASPVKPAQAPEPLNTAAPTVTAAAVTQTAPTEPAPTEPAVLTDAQRLVSVGLWKNVSANEWVRFNADGTGWWFDGTFFGCMTWKETAEGGVEYEAAMAYLGPEREENYSWAPEKEGDSLHSAKSNGRIGLAPEEDRFTCPGLRFGEGDYLPDGMSIDASVMDGVYGKTAAQLVSGKVWQTDRTSDLGIPCAPSGEEKPEIYTDKVYVQYMDFTSGAFRIATQNGGLLQLEQQAEIGMIEIGEPAPALDIPFALSAGAKETAAYFDIDVDAQYVFRSAYTPGDTQSNNMHLLWGHKFGPDPTRVYLLFTPAGPRIGFRTVDWYPHNYTLLAPAQ